MKRWAGDGRVGEATVAMSASTIGRGMFLTGMSLLLTWSMMSPVS